MLKRRSTLQTGEKSKRNKMTEYLLELDRCLQIPSDDKLVIRRKLKEGEEEVVGLFEAHRKDKNYHELQIKLRKIIQSEKSYEKRFTIHHGDRKKSEYNQRVYSQNSQNASFKNSVKASPEKQDGKKTLIIFDICELKKKMEDCHNESITSYHLTGSKSKPQVRLNSIGRMNTSINRSRESSFDRLPLKEQKQQPSASKLNLNNNNKQPSKITLRITQKRQTDKENIEATKLEQPKNQPEKNTFQNSNANVSYSSSIKTLLMSKLKDQKEKIYLKDPKKSDEFLMSNRSIESNQTAVKKSVRPMTRDQPTSNHKKDTYDKYPMYIQTTEYSQDQLRTSKKLQDFGYKNPLRCQKLQTLLSQPSERYGQFYMKIKDIINSQNY